MNMDPIESTYLHVSLILNAFLKEVRRPIGSVLEDCIDVLERRFGVYIEKAESLEEAEKIVEEALSLNITRLIDARELIEEGVLGVEKALGEIGNEKLLEILKEDGVEYLAPLRLLFLYKRAEKRGKKASLRYSDEKYEGFYIPVVIIFKRVFYEIMLKHPLCLLYRHVSMLLDSLMKETRRPFGNILEEHIERLTKKYASRILGLESIDEVSIEVEKIRSHIATRLIDGSELVEDYSMKPVKVLAEIPGREEMLDSLREHNIEFLAPVRLLFIYYRAKERGYYVVLRHADKRYEGFYLPVLVIYKAE